MHMHIVKFLLDIDQLFKSICIYADYDAYWSMQNFASFYSIILISHSLHTQMCISLHIHKNIFAAEYLYRSSANLHDTCPFLDLYVFVCALICMELDRYTRMPCTQPYFDFWCVVQVGRQLPINMWLTKTEKNMDSF